MATREDSLPEADTQEESRLRGRMGLLAILGAVLYLGSTLLSLITTNDAPTVGVLQAITPALRGIANPPVSPRAPEVIFIYHHSGWLVLAGVLALGGLVSFAWALAFLGGATRARRPEMIRRVEQLALGAAALTGAFLLANQVVNAIDTHGFFLAHVQDNHAADQALTSGTGRVVINSLSLLAELGLVVALVNISLNAMRTGLVTRFMGIIGILAGVQLIIPVGELAQVILVFWMAAIGVLLIGRWPGGDLAAWRLGVAVPWPSAAEERQRRAAASGRSAPAAAKPAPRSAAKAKKDPPAQKPAPISDPVPAPAPVGASAATANRRRRKRGGTRR